MPVISEQGRHVPGLPGGEHPLGQPEQADGQRDRDDERGGVVRSLETTEQALGAEPGQRRAEEHDDSERERGGQPVADVELEVARTPPACRRRRGRS